MVVCDLHAERAIGNDECRLGGFVQEQAHRHPAHQQPAVQLCWRGPDHHQGDQDRHRSGHHPWAATAPAGARSVRPLAHHWVRYSVPQSREHKDGAHRRGRDEQHIDTVLEQVERERRRGGRETGHWKRVGDEDRCRNSFRWRTLVEIFCSLAQRQPLRASCRLQNFRP